MSTGQQHTREEGLCLQRHGGTKCWTCAKSTSKEDGPGCWGARQRLWDQPPPKRLASPLLILLPTFKRVVETTDGWAGVEAASTGTGSQVGHTASSPWLGAGSRKQPDEGQ